MYKMTFITNKLQSFCKSSRVLYQLRKHSSEMKVSRLALLQSSSNKTLHRYYSPKLNTTPLSKEELPSPPPVNMRARRHKLIAMGVVGFSIYLVGLYFYEKSELEKRFKEQRRAKPIKVEPLPYLKNAPPDINAARSIRNSKDMSGLKLTLYQFQTCPFCCKVRAFLDYYGFSYDVVEVNSVSRKEVKWSGYKKVPFLTVELKSQGKDKESTYIQLKDSSMIVSLLSSCLRNPDESLENLLLSFPSYYDPENKNRLQFDNKYFIMYTEKAGLTTKQKYIKKERRLRQWVDDKFVHTLSPNVYRTPTEALQAFNWFSQVGDWERLFSTWERMLVIYVGAAAMWIIGKRLKSRYNINADPRITLYDQADLWMQEVKSAGGEFIGGDHPNLADLSMYGVLSAIEGCEAFEDMKKETKISDWYDKMKLLVSERKGEYKLAVRDVII